MEGNVSLPSELGGWQPEELIGTGAYGSVYKVSKLVGNRKIYSAVKIIEIPGRDDGASQFVAAVRDAQSARAYYKDQVDEYLNEIDMMEHLKGDSNIVSAEDYALEERSDQIGWRIYIRMEYLTSLPDYLAEKELTEKDVIQVGIDICSALCACEKAGIIHRDIKPENIFVSSSGKYKLGDFGIAKHLDGSKGMLSMKGSYPFMAPEVCQKNAYDKRVDIYSLGVVLYKLRNKNREPFLDTQKKLIYYKEREEALNRRMSGEALPRPVEASPEFASVILKACAFNPQDRYPSAEAMKRDLMKLKASMETGGDKKQKRTGSKLLPVATLSLLVMGILAAFVAHQLSSHHTKNAVAEPLLTEEKRSVVAESVTELSIPELIGESAVETVSEPESVTESVIPERIVESTVETVSETESVTESSIPERIVESTVETVSETESVTESSIPERIVESTVESVSETESIDSKSEGAIESTSENIESEIESPSETISTDKIRIWQVLDNSNELVKDYSSSVEMNGKQQLDINEGYAGFVAEEGSVHRWSNLGKLKQTLESNLDESVEQTVIDGLLSQFDRQFRFDKNVATLETNDTLILKFCPEDDYIELLNQAGVEFMYSSKALSFH